MHLHKFHIRARPRNLSRVKALNLNLFVRKKKVPKRQIFSLGKDLDIQPKARANKSGVNFIVLFEYSWKMVCNTKLYMIIQYGSEPVLIFTFYPASTVSKHTVGCLFQLIHIEISTVPDICCRLPFTGTIRVVIFKVIIAEANLNNIF